MRESDDESYDKVLCGTMFVLGEQDLHTSADGARECSHPIIARVPFFTYQASSTMGVFPSAECYRYGNNPTSW